MTPFVAIGSIAAGVLTGTSTAANITSAPFAIANSFENFSAQVGILTGTPTGYFCVDVSNDPRANDPTYSASAKWVEVQRVAYTTGVDASGLASSGVLVQNGWLFARVRWVGAVAGTAYAFMGGVLAWGGR